MAPADNLEVIQQTWDQLRNRCIGHRCPWCEPPADIGVKDSIGERHREGCLWLTMDRLVQKSKGGEA